MLKMHVFKGILEKFMEERPVKGYKIQKHLLLGEVIPEFHIFMPG